MSTYSRPVISVDAGMAEGVYAASGCYTATAEIKQTPETGRPTYVIQVNGVHKADHTKKAQTLTISFNQNVTFVSCYAQGAKLLGGDGTPTLTISLGYHQNPTDNIGFGDLSVKSGDGLAITGVSITD